MKKTILILTGYYLPGFKAGGPIQSISGMVEKLKDSYNFKIVCRDRDLGDKFPFSSEVVGHWYKYGSALLLRVPPGIIGATMILHALRRENYEILYLNSFCEKRFSVFPLLCRRFGLLPKVPVVLAPRGEFSDGALGIKPKRKQLYIAFANIAHLIENILWQATSEAEACDVRSALGNVNIYKAGAIANRGVIEKTEKDSLFAQNSFNLCENSKTLVFDRFKVPGVLRVVMLGRVCHMKNIKFSIEVFRHVKGQVTFDIYGPLEDEIYVAECKQLRALVSDSIEICFKGSISHKDVHETLKMYHVFMLPTLGENYGHVIAEAMYSGCIPLISDRTPWRDLVASNSGWDLSLLKPELFVTALQTALAWSDYEFNVMSKNVIRFVENHTLTRDAIQDNIMLFEAALGRFPRT